MMANKTNVPEIRFEGFSDAWIQRKLGEVAESFEYGLNASAKEFDGTHKYIRITDIDDSLRFFDESNLTSPDIEFSDADNYLLKHGDILFARTGASVGKSYIHKDSKSKVYFAGFLIRARFPVEYDVDFIYQNTLTEKYNTFIKIMSQRSGQPGVNAQEYASYSVGFSSHKEMQALGNFFCTLDSLITENQRKVENLKQLKTAYLQQMFPQAGERVPRVRFDGFSGDWEEKELGTLSMKVSQKNKDNRHSETLTNSAEYGIISQRDFFDKDISNQKNLDGYFVVQPDDFVYNPRISNHAPVGPIKRNLLGRTGVMSPLYYVFRIVEGNLTFIEKYFESIYWHEFMKLNGDNGVRSDRFNIKDSIFETMPIPFPVLEEQKAIGSFFNSIDTQISSQAECLNKLKQLKTAYLQKMFI